MLHLKERWLYLRLGDICKIESGLVLARKRARNDMEIEKSYHVLSLNNIEPHGDFNEKKLEKFPSNERLPDHYFTQVGDVLVRLNEPFTAVCIQEHQAGVLIPSYFVSIELTSEHYLPEYISWFINSATAKRAFHQAQSGSTISSINQRVIQNLKIPNVSLDEQEKITTVHHLYLQERRLLMRLIAEKDRYYNAITTKVIHGKMEERHNDNNTGKN